MVSVLRRVLTKPSMPKNINFNSESETKETIGQHVLLTNFNCRGYGHAPGEP